MLWVRKTEIYTFFSFHVNLLNSTFICCLINFSLVWTFQIFFRLWFSTICCFFYFMGNVEIFFFIICRKNIFHMFYIINEGGKGRAFIGLYILTFFLNFNVYFFFLCNLIFFFNNFFLFYRNVDFNQYYFAEVLQKCFNFFFKQN